MSKHKWWKNLQMHMPHLPKKRIKEEMKDIRNLKEEVAEQHELMEEMKEQGLKLKRQLDSLMPENELLRKWLCRTTGFLPLQVTEMIRMERAFPGVVEEGFLIAEKNGVPPNFSHFIIAARKLANDSLMEWVNVEQLAYLSMIKLDDQDLFWGKVKEYTMLNIDLVSMPLQRKYAEYVYAGTEELKQEVINMANGAELNFQTMQESSVQIDKDARL